MSLRMRLRILVHNFKDKASLIAASLSLKRHVSSVRVHVIRATSHTLSAPPSSSRIAAIISSVQGSYLLPRTCIDTLMDRLHKTQSATVALKCLFILHNLILNGPLTFKDSLSHVGVGHNALNLATFRDDTNVQTHELSSWVRWYANVLEYFLKIWRILVKTLNVKQNGTERVASSNELLCEIRGLVDFVQVVSHAPHESLHLQSIELVYNIVRLVCEDYGRVQRVMLRRVEECGKRVGDLDVEEVRELVGCVKRLEGCRERLGVLFVNKKRNDAFWDLIGRVKNKGVVVIEEMEGKWMTVVRCRNESAELTRFTNPFLEPGEFIYSGPTGWRVATSQPNWDLDHCSNVGAGLNLYSDGDVITVKAYSAGPRTREGEEIFVTSSSFALNDFS